MADLASVLGSLGRVDEAADLAEKGLHASERNLVETVPSHRWLWLNWRVFELCKKVSEFNSIVVKSREMSLGKTHPYVINVVANMAHTYREQGNWRLAEYLERVVLKRNI